MAKWQGSKPDRCQICDRSLSDDDVFIDGKTTRGPWAMMCFSCHKCIGVGLGTGKGQMYQLDRQNGDWLKVEG